MKILFLTDNFVPEQNASARRCYEHGRRWVKQGIEVTVVTTVPNFPTGKPYPPYRNRLYRREIVDGIQVIRVWSLLAPNSGVVMRALDFASFAISGFLAGLFQRPDIIVATSPQLLTAVSAHLLGRVKNRPWLFEVRDLWPESITAVGVLKEGFLMRVLRRLERRLYDGAERIVTVTEPMRALLTERGVSAGKLGMVPNGADLERLVPRSRNISLARKLNVQGKFVVAYVGTHGLAQGLEVVVHAGEILRHSDIHFVFVGEGARLRDLIELATRLDVSNLSFVGAVSSEAAIEYLALADAIVIPLRNSRLFEGALPTKIFEAAAMEKPILLSAKGIAAELVSRFQAGLVVEPENPEALAAAALRMRSDPELRERFQLGCRHLAQHHDRDRLADLMLAEIRHAAGPPMPLRGSAVVVTDHRQ